MKKLYQVICYVLADSEDEAQDTAAIMATKEDMLADLATAQTVKHDGFTHVMPVNGETPNDERTCMEIVNGKAVET